MMSALSEVEQGTSFVNYCRPSASIKTAVIRPITHLDFNPTSTENAVDKTHQDVKYTRGDVRNADKKMQTTLQNDHFLTDQSAIQYGTNATERRNRKVTEWFERTSLIQSEKVSPVVPTHIINHASLSHSPSMSNTQGVDSWRTSMLRDCRLNPTVKDLPLDDLTQELLAIASRDTTRKGSESTSQYASTGPQRLTSPVSPLQDVSMNGASYIRNAAGVQQNHNLNGSTQSQPPGTYLAALTIDVGQTIPNTRIEKYSINNSLMTVTSAQPIQHLYSEKQPTNKTVKHRTPETNNQSTVVNKITTGDRKMPEYLQSLCAMTWDRQGENQLIAHTQSSQKIYRSLSEPYTGAEYGKQSTFTRVPGKKERNSSLKVGMDVIRHKVYPPPKVHITRSTSHQENFRTSQDAPLPFPLTAPITHPQKMPSIIMSDGSDHVYMMSDRPRPSLTSTHYSSRSYATTLSNNNDQSSLKIPNHLNHPNRQFNDSLSSSFDSEAMDRLASLKSAAGMKQQLHKHQKVLTTETSPRTFDCSNKQTIKDNCLHVTRTAATPSPTNGSYAISPSRTHQSTPNSSTNYNVTTRHDGNNRRSTYDNHFPCSPPNGRTSITSASSAGTVFSRPWGDITKLEEYFKYPAENFRIRLDSAVSSQGRLLDVETPHNHSTSAPKSPILSAGSCSTSFTNTPINKLSKFPLNLPDVTNESINLTQSPLEKSLDNSANRIKQLIIPLQNPCRTCSITDYTTSLLTDRATLPGKLADMFIVCTSENLNSLSGYTRKTSRCESQFENQPPDWYSNLINGSLRAYSNDGFNTSTISSIDQRNHRPVITCEHLTLSNTRQLMDGLKHLFANLPDPQMMVAIQREKQKLNADEFLNMDVILEAAIEQSILKPLTVHLLNETTRHADYSLQQIRQISLGMKAIRQKKHEIFREQMNTLNLLDSYSLQLNTLFKDVMSEFSPLVKVHLLLKAFQIISSAINRTSCKQSDHRLVYLCTVCKYIDSSMLKHIVYIRHLIPTTVKCSVISFVLATIEACMFIALRYSTINPAYSHRPMILKEVLDKESIDVLILDESTSHTHRHSVLIGRKSNLSELLDIIIITVNHIDLRNSHLYLVNHDKEVRLKLSDSVSQLRRYKIEGCAIICKRVNTKLILPLTHN